MLDNDLNRHIWKDHKLKFDSQTNMLFLKCIINTECISEKTNHKSKRTAADSLMNSINASGVTPQVIAVK